MFNLFLKCTPQLSIKIKDACSITVYHYASFLVTSNTLSNLPCKNSIRRAPASSALTKSQTKAITCIPQYMQHSGEMNGVQKRTKVSFGRIMMQALELLLLAKKAGLGTKQVKISGL